MTTGHPPANRGAAPASPNPISRRIFLSFSVLGTPAILGACGGGNAEAATVNPAAAGVADPLASGLTPTAAALPPAPAPTPAMPPAPTPISGPATPAPSPAPSGPAAWDMGATLALVAGSEAAIDLQAMLPAGTPRGGVFSADPAGGALPRGITLSTSGVLTASASADVGSTQSVVFIYTIE